MAEFVKLVIEAVGIAAYAVGVGYLASTKDKRLESVALLLIALPIAFLIWG